MFKYCFLLLLISLLAQMPLEGKAVAAVRTGGKPVLDGKTDDPAWEEAAVFSDFESFPVKGKPLAVNTEVKLMYDAEYLYIGIKAFEKKADIRPVDDPLKLWSGDIIELYFGNINDKTRVDQYVFGPGKARWANHGDTSFWDFASYIGEDHWSAELRFPLKKLRLQNYCVRFNVCRQRSVAKDYQIWSSVYWDWQTIDGYGELIIGSYNDALRAKYTFFAGKAVDRKSYEKFVSSVERPIGQLHTAPYLHDMSGDAVSVGFRTVGKVRSRVMLREKNSSEVTMWRSNYRNYVWASDRDLHHVRFTGLKPGREYEYRIEIFDHVTNLWNTVPSPGYHYSFRMPEKDKSTVKFMIFSDMHNRYGQVAQFMALPQVKDCDFIVNLGDMVTYTHSTENIFTNYLDAQSLFACRKPLLNVRGNHELDGLAPEAFFEVFPHHTGRSYFLVRYGDICFVALDGGGHHITPEMHLLYAEENQWLKEAVKSPEFQSAKCRIILAHMPVMGEKSYGTNSFLKITDGVFTGKNPSEKADILLSGHTHEASITLPGSDRAAICGSDREKPVVPVPFPVICNDGPEGLFSSTVLLVTKSPDRLTVEIVTRDNRVVGRYELHLTDR